MLLHFLAITAPSQAISRLTAFVKLRANLQINTWRAGRPFKLRLNLKNVLLNA